MKVTPISIASIALPALLLGCQPSEKKGGAAAGPPKDGLTKLITEDIEIGKPTPFNPKITPIAEGDSVWVVYTGRYKDGTIFDTNDPKEKPDSRPLVFQAGRPGVIEGWQKGFLGMLPGGRRKLSVPWKMGYGPKGGNNIPGYSDLYFDVKVLDYVKQGEEFTYGWYDVQKGTGPEVKPGSTCVFHTVVRECDGKLMEDTRKGKPITAKQGHRDVLLACDDALLGMRKGGVRELSLPPPIGFPPTAAIGATPNMLFYLRIELIDVK